MESKTHWNKVYADKPANKVTWYQANPQQSLDMIAATDIPAGSAIIDVGGGMSFLVDHLLDAGYQDVTVLDIAGNALQSSKDHLDEKAGQVTWLEADVTEVQLPEKQYALWHDRAVFHFLTDAQDQQRYVTAVRRSLQPRGHIILATFALDGPQRCSGLDIVRYGEEEIKAVFGDGFRLVSSVDELHHTPWDTTQKFAYFHLTAEES
jgi:2-polyprenyl-3-methyl-5-hydroxy-6-metoxy-1,4-benzoquinol methylase